MFDVPLTMPIASFGENEAKAAVSTETGGRVKEVFMGGSYLGDPCSAAVMENGDLYCWGLNSDDR